MSRNPFTDRVLEALRDELRRAGWGSLAHTQRRLGLSRNYFQNLWSRARQGAALRVSLLGDVLDVLGVEPHAFFARAFPGTVAPRAAVREAAAALAAGGEPAAIRELRARLRTPPAAVDPGDRGDGGQVEQVDTLRYDDPVAAVALAEDAVRRADGWHQAARACAVWASALRMQGALDRALMAVGYALELAEASGSRHLLAEVVGRAAYIVADRGDYGRGLALADQALVLRSEVGDLDGVGRAHVDRGAMLWRFGHARGAVQAYRAGLRTLGQGSARYRFGAHQGLGASYLSLGELDRAERAAQRATEVCPPRGGHLRGRLTWLLALIATARGEVVRADQFYRVTLQSFKTFPADALLVAAELVRLRVADGRELEGCQLARSLTWLVIPLEGDRVLSAAHADLVRAGLEGGKALTLPLLDRTIATIRRSRPGLRNLRSEPLPG